MIDILIIILVFVLMGVGLLGSILPFLPGAPIAWIGLFIYSYYTHFVEISLKTNLIFLGIIFLVILIDLILPLLGAKKYKASRQGVIGSFLGLLVGLMVGPFGVIIMPLIGGFVGELIAGKKSEKAFRTALGVFLGSLVGIFLQVIIILIMLGFFIVALF